MGDAGEYSDLDLDIRNYTLHELLELLQLPMGFVHADLRRSMRLVARLHPDKSGAPPEVYRLFYTAHVMCRQLLAARDQGDASAQIREDYDTPEGRHIADEVGRREDFQNWFNDSFEEFHKTLPQQSAGYDEWLAEEVVQGPKVRNQADMVAEMAKRRKEVALKAVVLAGGPMPASMGGGTMLVASEEPMVGVTGGMVGDIAYGDLKQSYEESIVPLVEVDGFVTPKYSNVEELMEARLGLDVATAEYWKADEREGEKERRELHTLMSTDARMHSLLQQEQEQRDAHARWQAQALALTGGRAGDYVPRN
jgi:hypothetical protein